MKKEDDHNNGKCPMHRHPELFDADLLNSPSPSHYSFDELDLGNTADFFDTKIPYAGSHEFSFMPVSDEDSNENILMNPAFNSGALQAWNNNEQDIHKRHGVPHGYYQGQHYAKQPFYGHANRYALQVPPLIQPSTISSSKHAKNETKKLIKVRQRSN